MLLLLSVSIGLILVSARRAQELARQQMEFVAAVSHELRTPLARIRLLTELARDGDRVGRGLVAGPPAVLVDGREVAAGGWDHFAAT